MLNGVAIDKYLIANTLDTVLTTNWLMMMTWLGNVNRYHFMIRAMHWYESFICVQKLSEFPCSNRIAPPCTQVRYGAIRLFANDVIIIGLVRADWPAPFSVTIGNPRADKLGRNGFECIVLRCSVDRERCVLTTFMHSAIENYSMLHLQRWMECRGIKRSGTKSLFMIISHNCQSCLCRQP